jgi:nucleoredoxin
VKGDLVSWHNGSLSRFEDEPLEKKKLIALYFSAHWCAPCRAFTPKLVDFYNRVAPQHPEFEIIFVSFDRSQFAMETYMRETNMPWPAIDYPKVASKEAIRKYAGDGIPCLVLLDATGKVVSDSFAGKQYLGPGKVLTDLDAIFAGNVAGNATASR